MNTSVSVPLTVVAGVTAVDANVAVAVVPATWLLTARPTKIVDGMATVSDPTVVQFVPSVDTDAVIVVPVRVSLTKRGALPAPPDVSDLAGQLAGLDVLAAQGRWSRLEAELDQLSRQATALASGCRDAERQAVGLLERRDELRGLLDAYRARAAKLGGAEDAGLDERYDRAHGLLWAAPCDLPAAADAVTGYQQAVLALSGRGQQR